ncbi:alcohol dehydrogenase catalytic domain-containing protein [Staphylococcus nepalensis]|jgi:L-idonate 5-dehydrogenase|uniref:zinc-binding dehydrogenase n=1 Tax=Staphylococcus TaxID=1279 RepID=UPI001AEC657E|nr:MULTISPECIES: zinc-binding dehydrogenase [Staphylococcus]MCD8892078.1 alcohol dehydrogenase catalytic domain-containing protein [Staphylococcus nepalensis]
MKAVFINGKEDIELRDVETLNSHEDDTKVLIEVKYVGICGSDLHYLAEGASGPAVIREPLTPGHELSGILLGDMEYQGETLPKGTKVTVHPATYGEKIERLPNNPEVWPNGAYLGSARYLPHQQGAMVEKMLVDKSQILALPDKVSLKLGALAEPLSVGMHAINLAGGVKDKSVLVSGAGPIGLLAAGAAYTLGAKSVTITDMLEEPLSRAKDMGDIKTLNIKENDVPEDQYDVILECSGATPAISTAFKAINIGGVIIQVGNLQDKAAPINLSPINIKQATYRGCYRFNSEIEDALKVLEKNEKIGNVVTQTYHIEAYKEAFEVAANSRLSSKVMIAF